MPDPRTADAELEAWRCLRSVLLGEPVPVIDGGLAQDVIDALARRAAGAFAGRLGDIGTSDDGGRRLVLGYVEDRMSRCLLDERTWLTEGAPLPPAEAGD